MKANLDEIERDRPDLFPLVSKSTEILEEQLGQSAPLVHANWQVARDDRGRELIGLDISDWTGSVGYRFTKEELSDPNHMKSRLYRLWGDLLMIQSHAHLDQLNWQLQHDGDV